jgi:threonine aldolase
MKTTAKKKHFGSDNYSGVHPRIIEVISEVADGHVPSYGNDEYTKRAEKAFQKVFGDVEVFFVFNGTAANVLSLFSSLDSFEAVICSERAHIHEDEGGAPEKFLGAKLVTLAAPNGKITVEQIHAAHRRDFDQHRVQTRIVSLTQSTEYGTRYELDEISEISKWCKKHDHLLHIDGARLANAAVSLGVDLRKASHGCDVLSFGATKNGLLFGEAVVFFNKGLAKYFKNYRKQAMQLMSKMRFTSIQLETYLLEDLWKENATNSNKMALLLEKELSKIKEITFTQKVQANAIFAKIPSEIVEKVNRQYNFYVWRELSKKEVEVRWMTSFDTTEKDVKDFVGSIKSALQGARPKSKA